MFKKTIQIDSTNIQFIIIDGVRGEINTELEGNKKYFTTHPLCPILQFEPNTMKLTLHTKGNCIVIGTANGQIFYDNGQVVTNGILVGK